jgi:flagellar motor protein MotB
MGFRVLKPSFKEYQSLPVVATSTSSIGEGKFAYAATHFAPAASGAGQCVQANSLDPRLAAEDPARESQYGKKHRLTLHTRMPTMSMATSCFGTYGLPSRITSCFGTYGLRITAWTTNQRPTWQEPGNGPERGCVRTLTWQAAPRLR